MADDYLSTPIKTGQLSWLVLERIETALINRDLKPGDMLPPEKELAASFNVGKSSVREAVKMLEALGVVEVRPGSGTFICSHGGRPIINALSFQLLLHQGTWEDVVELRRWFEISSTLLAMKNRTPHDLDRLAESIRVYEENILTGKQSLENDLKFHYLVLDATHNPFIVLLGDAILRFFSNYIGKSVSVVPKEALNDHKAILKAMREQDAEAVEQAINNSLIKWNTIMENFETKENLQHA